MRINRKFGLLFITLIICACNNNEPKEVLTENDVTINDKVETSPIKNEILIVLPDTLFYVNGKTQVINGLKCNIQYEVKGDSGVRDLEQGVQILKMVLKTPSQNIPIEYVRLYKTDKHSLQKLKSVFALIGGGLLEDVNKDGYDDIKVEIDIGPNNSYTVFLFSKEKRAFEQSDLYSGMAVEYDKKLNRISTFYTAGVGYHVYSYYNLNKDRKTLAFEEHIEMDNGTITYEKIIGKKVVKRKTKVLGRDGDVNFYETEWLERGRSGDDAYK